jgi:hypothetical protein
MLVYTPSVKYYRQGLVLLTESCPRGIQARHDIVKHIPASHASWQINGLVAPAYAQGVEHSGMIGPDEDTDAESADSPLFFQTLMPDGTWT